jgi:hypothetical protein
MTATAFTHIKEYQREGQNMKIPFIVTKKYKRRKRKRKEEKKNVYASLLLHQHGSSLILLIISVISRLFLLEKLSMLYRLMSRIELFFEKIRHMFVFV